MESRQRFRRFFFDYGFKIHQTVFQYLRRRFANVFEGGRKHHQSFKLGSWYKEIEQFEDNVNELAYLVCDRKQTEIEILEKKTIYEYYLAISMFLKNIERMQKQAEKNK